eukprot:10737282-Lingulodinium_polyedra.AAC.1
MAPRRKEKEKEKTKAETKIANPSLAWFDKANGVAKRFVDGKEEASTGPPEMDDTGSARFHFADGIA